MRGWGGRRAGAATLAAAVVGLALWAINDDDPSEPVERLSAAAPAPTLEPPGEHEPSTTSTTSTTVRRSTTTTAAHEPVGSPATTSTTTTAPPPRGTPVEIRDCPPTPVRKQTKEELAAGATRAWILCAPGSPFGTDDGGLEIRADGRWSKLTREDDGSLTRRHGFDEEGTWEVATPYQINLHIAGSGMIAGGTSFSADGSSMTINNNGVHEGHYVVVPENAVIPDDWGPAGDECVRNEGAEYRPPTEDAFDAAVTHVWLACEGGTFFGHAPNTGLEIRSDGTWFRLYRQGDHYRRLRRDGETGRWESIDTSQMNGRPTYQLTLNTSNGGGYSTHPHFASETSKMRLNNIGVAESDYIHAPEGTVVSD